MYTSKTHVECDTRRGTLQTQQVLHKQTTNKQTAQGARLTQTHETDARETEGQPQTQTQMGADQGD
eukprot:6515923-Prymnesium_polylepis.1